MKQSNILPTCVIPEDGLKFFHSLSVWVEESKRQKARRIQWGKGQNEISILTCVKYPKGIFTEPQEMMDNTLYVPSYSSGYYVICQLRHAFCHADIAYNSTNGQYEIHESEKVHIAGKFSLDAIKEFVLVYIQQTQPQNQTK